MTKTLYLFTGLTPNIKGHPYYNIRTFDNYLLYLREHYYCKVLTDDNYRINANIIKIENVTSNNLFTYAIEVDSEGAHRCYFINTITKQSNMLYLNLTIDYWGTYYTANKVDYLHIIRCNRNIGTGIYDDIKTTKHYEENNQELYKGEVYKHYDHLFKISDLYLIVSIAYNAIENLAGTDIVSTQNLYAVRLSSLKEAYKVNIGTQEEPEYYYLGTIEQIISDFLGGIYGIEGNVPAWLANLDAKAIKAFIIPRNEVDITLEETITLKSKSILGFSQLDDDEARVQVYAVKSGRTKIDILINNFNPNFDYIAGTTGNKGLKLTRFTQNFEITYVFDFKRTDLNIYVRQGENEQDITQNFEVSIVGTASQQTELAKIGHIISTSLNFLQSALRGYAKMGGTGAFLGVASGLADMATNEGAGLKENIIANSDAMHTYGLDYLGTDYANYMRSPYCINKYESINNENLHARYFGANFNIIVEDINSIFNYMLLGYGIIDYDLTLIVADDVKINYLPTIARQEIENAFTSGVELLDYEGTNNE